MRVQQQGQALRVRIDESELARLLAGDTVTNTTRWPDGSLQVQRVILAEEAVWQHMADGWLVHVPATAVRDLATQLPSRDGLSFVLGGLVLSFDVDVRDSARRLREGRA